LRIRTIRTENRLLRRELKKGLENLLGQSAAMKESKNLSRRSPPPDQRLLITAKAAPERTGRTRFARFAAPGKTVLHFGELRRVPRNAAGERIVRIHEGIVHWRD